ncbi:MAG TPA: hypothetical protein VKZ57_15985, partial [Sphingobacterium sp.]|nr:hypothetical protein [Sphingobacterium sp.]
NISIMNNRYLFLFLFFCTVMSTAHGQVSTIPPKHNFSIGPIAGYDYDIKGPIYGGGLMYEYRPFKKVGFTAGFTYEQTRKDFSESSFGDETLRHEVYALHVGARYYIGDFYLGGALGVGHDKGTFKQEEAVTRSGGSAYSLYKSIGAGYQIPLRNQDALEVEAGTFGTSNSMKVGGTVRYKFRK